MSSKTVAVASLFRKNKSSPFFPRSGGDAGEVVEVVCRGLASLAGRGGVGRCGPLWGCGFFRSGGGELLLAFLRPAVVARGGRGLLVRAPDGFRGVNKKKYGDPEQGTRPVRVVPKWCELGVSRRPMQDPPEVVRSNSPELVAHAALNACGLGAPPASWREEEDDVVLVGLCLYLYVRHPEVRWAQRIDKVYITVQLPDAKDAKVNLEPDGVFSFSATAGTDGNSYESKLDLNDKVNVEASKISVGVRSIFCILEKAEAKWWNKLVRDDQKAPHFVKVDWDKWVDEDDDGADVNVDGMDFSNMGGMGGMPGMEGLGGMGGMGGGMGGMPGMEGLMGGMGGMGMPPGMGMDEFEDESDDEGEVSKPQDAGKADAAEMAPEVEGKAGSN